MTAYMQLVSEAVGRDIDRSKASAYIISDDGSLQVVSACVPANQTATCWVIVTNGSHYAYTTNAGQRVHYRFHDCGRWQFESTQ